MQLDRRRDVAMTKIINTAIVMDKKEGAVRAWIFLSRHGVSPNSIHRVLALDGHTAAKRRPYTEPLTAGVWQGRL